VASLSRSCQWRPWVIALLCASELCGAGRGQSPIASSAEVGNANLVLERLVVQPMAAAVSSGDAHTAEEGPKALQVERERSRRNAAAGRCPQLWPAPSAPQPLAWIAAARREARLASGSPYEVRIENRTCTAGSEIVAEECRHDGDRGPCPKPCGRIEARNPNGGTGQCAPHRGGVGEGAAELARVAGCWTRV